MIGRRIFLRGSALLGSTLPWVQALPARTSTSDPGPATPTPQTTKFTYVETRGAPSAASPKEAKALAAHAVHLAYDDLDEGTRRKTKRRILDLFGCALGGVHGTGNAALVQTLHAQGGPAEATVIGYGIKLPAANAAMANAIIARSYDYEVMTAVVGDRLIGSHNSPTTCMTALALCERAGVSGKEFITALTAGDDIAARMLAASGLDLGRGWDSSSIFTATAAAAIAARILGATEQQAQDALGLATDMICGTTQSVWDGTPAWKFVGGITARNSVLAAELARTGEWPGIRDGLRAPYALYGQFTAGCVDPEILTAELGRRFYGEEYFKPYPSCAATHAMHECAFQMRDEHKLNAGQISACVVRVPAFVLSTALAQAFHPARDPHTSANFSILYQVANGLLRGPVRQEHYASPAINSPQIADLIGKTSLKPLSQEQQGVEIELSMLGGARILGRHSGIPMRNPSRTPMSDQEVIEKFRGQARFSGAVAPRITEQIVERVNRLEEERNIGELVALMGRAA